MWGMYGKEKRWVRRETKADIQVGLSNKSMYAVLHASGITNDTLPKADNFIVRFKESFKYSSHNIHIWSFTVIFKQLI